MGSTVRSVDFIFEGGPVLFQLSSYFYVYISGTNRGVTFILTLDRHVISSFLTHWIFPRKSLFFWEILRPEYWNNRDRLMSLTIRSAVTLFLKVDLYCFNFQVTLTLISAERKEVWLSHLHLIDTCTAPFLRAENFLANSPFFSEILRPEY